uniref:Acylphosphatase-like domain-containing protein n=1 Tax=Pseudictyota dubia TaxID=2749911 RepID=A0A7R9ZE38_9STRA|mmetsp:Transcript_44691/g.82890  ORF Transcript_44691/g.82890 Transcript_44691/m.82890 type:complete len:163 (+) Transcript_44691:367-855(+)
MRSVYAAALFAAFLLAWSPRAEGFGAGLMPSSYSSPALLFGSKSVSSSSVVTFMKADEAIDPNEIVGKRIIVSGDVNGGYVRSCVLNEAGRFRRLVGTMSPVDEDSDTAEIYVEGKRKMVDGFIRWCERGSKQVGLSQKLEVVKVEEEDPTGLYDGFYAKTH